MRACGAWPATGMARGWCEPSSRPPALLAARYMYCGWGESFAGAAITSCARLLPAAAAGGVGPRRAGLGASSFRASWRELWGLLARGAVRFSRGGVGGWGRRDVGKGDVDAGGEDAQGPCRPRG